MAQSIALTEPYLIGRLLNHVQSELGKPDLFSGVVFYLALYVAVQFGFWLVHGPGRVLERFVAFFIRTNFRETYFRIVTELPVKWHRDNHSGDSIDKINRAANSIYEFSGGGFEVIYMVTRLVGSLGILLFFIPRAGAAALAVTAIALVIIYNFDRVLFHLYKAINKFENRVASAVQDYITNVITVITLRLESRVRAEVRRRMFKSLSDLKRNFILNEVKWFTTNILIALMIAAVLGWYCYPGSGSTDKLMAGTFFTLFEYLRRIGDCFYTFAYKYSMIVRQAADVSSAAAIEDSYLESSQLRSEARLPEGWRQVEVRELSFIYEDEKHRPHHLRDVSLNFSRGARIALVGESGSGKSTLLSILRGLQPAEKVRVLVDGVELPEKLKHLMPHTTLLPQDPEIFADTIRFNISFGLDAPDEEILEALRLAQFEPVLRRLPKGLETSIAEKGVNLSGGEKQRLALARGIFFAKDTDILLLDEPTSSVDITNEKIIYRNLMATFGDKCLVSSIHKLHLLDQFDQIYLFRDGEIIERGTFSELLSKTGTLARMWREYQQRDDKEIQDDF